MEKFVPLTVGVDALRQNVKKMLLLGFYGAIAPHFSSYDAMCTIDGDLLKTLENSGFMIATRRGLRSFRF